MKCNVNPTDAGIRSGIGLFLVAPPSFDVNTYWTTTKTSQTKIDGSNSAISGLLGSKRSFQG